MSKRDVTHTKDICIPKNLHTKFHFNRFSDESTISFTMLTHDSSLLIWIESSPSNSLTASAVWAPNHSQCWHKSLLLNFIVPDHSQCWHTETLLYSYEQNYRQAIHFTRMIKITAMQFYFICMIKIVAKQFTLFVGSKSMPSNSLYSYN